MGTRRDDEGSGGMRSWTTVRDAFEYVWGILVLALLILVPAGAPAALVFAFSAWLGLPLPLPLPVTVLLAAIGTVAIVATLPFILAPLAVLLLGSGASHKVVNVVGFFVEMLFFSVLYAALIGHLTIGIVMAVAVAFLWKAAEPLIDHLDRTAPPREANAD